MSRFHRLVRPRLLASLWPHTAEMYLRRVRLLSISFLGGLDVTLRKRRHGARCARQRT